MSLINHVDAARELAGLRRELESATADRVQLEALYATAREQLAFVTTDRAQAVSDAKQYKAMADRYAKELHAANNDRTALRLERDALDRKCAALALLHYGPKTERATTGG